MKKKKPRVRPTPHTRRLFLVTAWYKYELGQGNATAALRRPTTIRITVFLFWFTILVVFVLWAWISVHYVVAIMGSA